MTDHTDHTDVDGVGTPALAATNADAPMTARADGAAPVPESGAPAGPGTLAHPEAAPAPENPGTPAAPECPADPDPERELGPRLFHLTMLLRRAEGHGSHGAPGGPGAPGPRHHQMGQGRVLALLAMRSPIAQRELAYLLGIRPQSLGEILGKLEAAGLITRSVDPTDARARLVAITDAGSEAVQALAQAPRTDPLAPLSEAERTQFLDMIDRVTAGLEEALGIDDELRGPFPMGGPEGLFPPDGSEGPFPGGGPRGGRGRGRGSGGPGRRGGPGYHGHGGSRGPQVPWDEPDETEGRRRFRGRRGLRRRERDAGGFDLLW